MPIIIIGEGLARQSHERQMPLIRDGRGSRACADGHVLGVHFCLLVLRARYVSARANHGGANYFRSGFLGNLVDFSET